MNHCFLTFAWPYFAKHSRYCHRRLINLRLAKVVGWGDVTMVNFNLK